MSYQFSFDRKRLLALIAGQVFVALLMFAGGMVAGIAMWAPSRHDIALLKNKGEVSPVVAAEAAVPKLPAMPQPAIPHAAEAPAPTPQPAAPAPAETAAVQKPAPAAPAAAPAETAPVRLVTSEASGEFCLQLGSFEKAENARKLQSDLKDKGIAAIIFDQTDSASQRTWHAVRVGGYGSLDSAAQAAADFSNKWRIQAMVRRSDSL
ncbi:MAG TPA: SPOR domain-containing protein [Candidatus Limnocylindrales bacterium]|nr:SPOR domain-containing protein [Candidatus Limnocylindrales bacterium]